MKKITFRGFLKQYLLDLSGQTSLSIHKLSKISKKNYRLLDPLLLYCLLENKMDIFDKYFNQNPDLDDLTKDNYLDDRFADYSL